MPLLHRRKMQRKQLLHTICTASAEDTNKKDRMKQCSGCNKWFHAACLSLLLEHTSKGFSKGRSLDLLQLHLGGIYHNLFSCRNSQYEYIQYITIKQGIHFAWGTQHLSYIIGEAFCIGALQIITLRWNIMMISHKINNICGVYNRVDVSPV